MMNKWLNDLSPFLRRNLVHLCLLIAALSFSLPVSAQKMLIPMDLKQNDHLKAYGIAFKALEKEVNVEWLLNYRGGSFMMNYSSDIENDCLVRGVTALLLSA
ncbi:asparagine synthetase B, partial [bacterium]|nr:asparagine synthetase B [bacterium]